MTPTQTSCTITRESPENYHTFALFNPLQNGKFNDPCNIEPLNLNLGVQSWRKIWTVFPGIFSFHSLHFQSVQSFDTFSKKTKGFLVGIKSAESILSSRKLSWLVNQPPRAAYPPQFDKGLIRPYFWGVVRGPGGVGWPVMKLIPEKIHSQGTCVTKKSWRSLRKLSKQPGVQTSERKKVVSNPGLFNNQEYIRPY